MSSIEEMQRKTAEAERKGADARRLLEQIAPYFDALEKRALDVAVAQQWQHTEGEENTRRLLERVSVIRALRVELASEIDAGAAAVKHLEAIQTKSRA